MNMMQSEHRSGDPAFHPGKAGRWYQGSSGTRLTLSRVGGIFRYSVLLAKVMSQANEYDAIGAQVRPRPGHGAADLGEPPGSPPARGARRRGPGRAGSFGTPASRAGHAGAARRARGAARWAGGGAAGGGGEAPPPHWGPVGRGGGKPGRGGVPPARLR